MNLARMDLLWLVPLAVAVAALPLWFNRQMLSRRARFLSLALRAAALALVLAALMEPGVVTQRSEEEAAPPASAVFVVDVSASLEPRQVERALEAVKRACSAGPSRPEVLLAAGEVRRVTPQELDSLASMAPMDWLKSLEGLDLRTVQRSTHLEKALRLAADLPARSLVLFSDGNETQTGAEKVVPVLQHRAIQLSAAPLTPLAPDTLTLASLTMPQSVLEGRDFHGQLVIACAAAGQCRLVLKRGDKVVRDEMLAVGPGPTPVAFEDKLPSAGLYSYVATVTAVGGTADARVEDNSAHGATRAVRVPKVLLVSDEPRPVGVMLDAAKLQHRDVSPGEVPGHPKGLSDYSAVILDNVDAGNFGAATQKLLASYVREQGGGLVMLGGEHGFGAGGWADTEVDKVLPVDAAPKGYDRSLGLIVLLDASGSMAGFPIQYARKAVKEIIGLMRGRWLGVIKFTHYPEVAVSFQIVGADSYVVRQDIEAIEAGGGTLFHQPVSMAMDILSKVQLDQKHILLLSDGVAADGFLVRGLYDQLNGAEIKVSTMAVGRYVDTALLEDLADSTGGRFYQGEDFSKLPDMFRQEVKRISGPPIVEAPIRPTLSANPGPMAAIVPPGELPMLHGYDATTAKPRAEVVLRSPQGDPILATWRIGVGRSAAFTSDLHNWGRDWVTWPEAPRFVGGLMGELGRLEASDFHVTASSSEGQGHVVVDAIDSAGQYLNFLELTGRITDPGGKHQNIALRQTGPGRYDTTFPMPVEGAYAVQVVKREAGKQMTVGEAVAALPFLPEYRPAGVNRALLARLCSATGGKLIEAEQAVEVLAAVPTRPAGPPRATLPLWPAVAVLALFVFLAEIACRRLGKFSGSEESERGDSGSEDAAAYQKIAENYLRIARDMDARGESARASEAYLKARSYYLKAQQDDKAKMMWDRYRLLEDKRAHRR
ncbi:MAG: FixH family protein [Candidatus Riflebacteria bacterium]|nr:FixH family protein [Candidatus Riflebacteria bacterium]